MVWTIRKRKKNLFYIKEGGKTERSLVDMNWAWGGVNKVWKKGIRRRNSHSLSWPKAGFLAYYIACSSLTFNWRRGEGKKKIPFVTFTFEIAASGVNIKWTSQLTRTKSCADDMMTLIGNWVPFFLDNLFFKKKKKFSLLFGFLGFLVRCVFPSDETSPSEMLGKEKRETAESALPQLHLSQHYVFPL